MRYLLDIESLADDDISALMQRANALASGAAPRVLHGSVANVFMEPSTRTRVSFELAARRLGLDVVTIEQASSSASKGESLLDTARTLSAMGVEILVLRHRDDEAVRRLAEQLGLSGHQSERQPERQPGPSIVNAGSGGRAHPSQALLDAVTLARTGLDWPQATIAIVGDIRHSRVARSGIALFSRLGAGELRIAGPREFMPDDNDLPHVQRHDRIDTALRGANVVICLRIQRERITGSYPDGAAYHRQWGLTAERLEQLPPTTCILHPGPVNHDVEIAAELVHGPRSLILEQVRIGVHLRTALFEWLLEPSQN